MVIYPENAENAGKKSIRIFKMKFKNLFRLPCYGFYPIPPKISITSVDLNK